MLFKFLSLAAFTASAFAQQAQDLNSTLSSNNQTSQLASLLAGFPDLVQGLASATNVTLLAPSNDAIETLLNSSLGETLSSDPGLLRAVLQYHVLNGTYPASAVTNTSTFIPTLLLNDTYSKVSGGQRVNAVLVGEDVTFFSGLNMNSSVVQADVNFTGGVIHIIDSVLTVPQNATTTALAANLTSLAGAVTEADLVSTLDNGLRDITIFAPSNEAFAAVGSAFENASTDALTSVLTYHVVNGTVGYSSALEDGLSLQTVGGGNVTITIENGTVFVNSAAVVVPDVLISNGVVHVIDNVLNPNNTSATPSASATAGSPGFTGASSVSEAPFTSGVPEPSGSSTVGGGASEATSTAASGSSSSSSGFAMPMKTAAVAPAALFGAGVVMLNL